MNNDFLSMVKLQLEYKFCEALRVFTSILRERMPNEMLQAN